MALLNKDVRGNKNSGTTRRTLRDAMRPKPQSATQIVKIKQGKRVGLDHVWPITISYADGSSETKDMNHSEFFELLSDNPEADLV